MTESQVKEILKNHYIGTIIDIDIYFNDDIGVSQATVLVLTKHHIIERYLVDETGFISFDFMVSSGNSVILRN